MKLLYFPPFSTCLALWPIIMIIPRQVAVRYFIVTSYNMHISESKHMKPFYVLYTYIEIYIYVTMCSENLFNWHSAEKAFTLFAIILIYVNVWVGIQPTVVKLPSIYYNHVTFSRLQPWLYQLYLQEIWNLYCLCTSAVSMQCVPSHQHTVPCLSQLLKIRITLG